MGVPVVVCPLEFERRIVARALRMRAKVIRSGPGPDAAAEAVASIRAERPPLVILCGVAGGLEPTARVPPIGRVLDSNARSWTPAMVAPGEGEPVVLLGVTELITTPDRKRQMARAFGAQLADCESHGFARSASEAGLRWAIVRAVSDGPDDRLPESAGSWVDERGRTRFVRVIMQTILEPSSIPSVIKLGLRSRGALKAAAAVVREMLDREKQAAADPFGDTKKTQAMSRQTRPNPTTGAKKGGK